MVRCHSLHPHLQLVAFAPGTMALPPAVGHWWNGMGFTTRGVLATLVAFFVTAQILRGVHAGRNPFHSCLLPNLEDAGFSVIAFFLAPLCHANILHLLFNAWACSAQLQIVEEALGSTGAAFVTLATLLLSQLLMVVAGSLLSAHSCTLGFSGVLFALITIDAFGIRPDAKFSLCGLLELPAWATPFALLLLSAVLFADASLLGHACGIAAGYTLVRLVRRQLCANPLNIAPRLDAQFGPKFPNCWRDCNHPERSWAGQQSAATYLPRFASHVEPTTDRVGGVSDMAAPGAPSPHSSARSGWQPFVGAGRTLGGSGSGTDSTRGAGQPVEQNAAAPVQQTT
jgi:membrane associated rhomboid family serine protease